VGCISMCRNKLDEMRELIIEFDLPITYTPLGRKRKFPHRRMTILEGLMPKGENDISVETVDGQYIESGYTAYSPTLSNTLEALVLRCFIVNYGDGHRRVIKPVPGIFKNLDYLSEDLALHLGDRRLITMEECVEKMPAHRRKCYRLALANLFRHVYDALWENVKGFTKFQREAEGGVPRMINPNHEEEIIQQGAYVKSYEEEGHVSLYRALDELWYRYRGVEFPVCSKGLDTFQWGSIVARKWRRFGHGRKYTSLDCKRFSQHASKEALEFVAEAIEKTLPGAFEALRPKKRKCVSQVPDEDGTLHRVVAELPEMLNDGSPWTACAAHVIINLIMIHELPEGMVIEPLDCGDDFGFISEDSVDLDELHLILLRYGFFLKVEDSEVTELNRLEFCKSSPISIGGDYRMIRRPECLRKDCLMLCGMDQYIDRMFAVGMGGCHINCGVPVYHNFYRCLIRLSGLLKYKKKHTAILYGHNFVYYSAMIKQGVDRNKLVAISYSCEDRLEFYKTTGIEPHIQEIMEEFYDNVVFGDNPTDWNVMW
jgi:hypothetical protein